ncbi:MAG: preprotein translocase subunit SecE [Candidatus Omnitrophica bacterium]|nr:MAG: Protein translocase subunit SecE [Candidatus Hinthialibacteria bacterium OLB16]MBE7486867.1 preprotein translocase subunit SecE [bacterium]MBK7495404.1 preprotein translocase subunit SecE [Candidatus Omnitrophota bacterium]MCE7906742.1 preprotein translocase subunit SecE [Candidatus Omnitrophica bacterium COP1]MBV6480330.1 Protein translocase subunit SecE [bacterium]
MEQFIQRCIDNLKKSKKIRESRAGQFLISVLAELQKVTWPTYEEVKNSTFVTLIVMVVMSIYMGGAQALVTATYNLMKRLI